MRSVRPKVPLLDVPVLAAGAVVHVRAGAEPALGGVDHAVGAERDVLHAGVAGAGDLGQRLAVLVVQEDSRPVDARLVARADRARHRHRDRAVAIDVDGGQAPAQVVDVAVVEEGVLEVDPAGQGGRGDYRERQHQACHAHGAAPRFVCHILFTRDAMVDASLRSHPLA
jgi:hypothetical protein